MGGATPVYNGKNIVGKPDLAEVLNEGELRQ